MNVRIRMRSALVRNALVAAIVGASVGVVAGLLSIGRGVPRAASPAPMATSAVSRPKTAPERRADADSAVQPRPQGSAAAPQPLSAAIAVNGARPQHADVAPANSTRAPSDSQGDVLQRARSLAQRADVKALVALRETTAQRAAERGESASAERNPVLAELDRDLAAARVLRLKLDADEFRNARTDSSRQR
jgi:hypothetical protein